MPYANPERQQEAKRRSYQKNRERVIRGGRTARRERQALVRKAKEVPCADCGIQYPHYVMDFDHLDPSQKKRTVAVATANCGMPKLLEEIAKCEVVCSNCHRIRTWKDFDFEILP